MGEVAAHRGQVPHERIGDDAARVGQERVSARTSSDSSRSALAREGADPQRAVRLAHVARSGMPLMSTTCRGLASRSFMSGIRLCPPERILASSPSRASNAVASASVVGRVVVERGGDHRGRLPSVKAREFRERAVPGARPSDGGEGTGARRGCQAESGRRTGELRRQSDVPPSRAPCPTPAGGQLKISSTPIVASGNAAGAMVPPRGTRRKSRYPSPSGWRDTSTASPLTSTIHTSGMPARA